MVFGVPGGAAEPLLHQLAAGVEKEKPGQGLTRSWGGHPNPRKVRVGHGDYGEAEFEVRELAEVLPPVICHQPHRRRAEFVERSPLTGQARELLKAHRTGGALHYHYHHRSPGAYLA